MPAIERDRRILSLLMTIRSNQERFGSLLDTRPSRAIHLALRRPVCAAAIRVRLRSHPDCRAIGRCFHRQRSDDRWHRICSQ